MSRRRHDRNRSVASARQAGLAVVLEDIHDPHNAAAVMRTCDAFGIQDVRLIYEREAYANPRRIGKKSSSSASKWLDLTIYRSTHACLSALKRKGYEIVATALDARAIPLNRCRLSSRKIALFFGNEHRGLSPRALAAADTIVAIPMLGFVQSLNLSVTAAIVIAEVARQRERSGKSYHLSPARRVRLERVLRKRA